MKQFLLALVAAVIFAATASATTSYSFSTSATYSSGVGGGTVVNDTTNCPDTGDLCIQFSDSTSGDFIELVYLERTNSGNATEGDNFGSVEAICDNSSFVSESTCTGATLSGDITITLDQSSPTSGSDTFIDSLSGTIANGTGFGTISFSQTSFTIGSLGYSMQQPVGGYTIDAPSDATAPAGPDVPSPTTFQGTVTDLSTPEPATFAIMGAGLLAIGMITRRKRA